MRVYRTDSEFTGFCKESKAQSVLIVCDINTRRFADKFFNFLNSASKNTEFYIFQSKHLIPEIANLKELIGRTKDFDYLLAVGSGTINDICKYVSHILKKPYGIYATAPSMDGYASSVSALYENRRKVTLPTTIPADVFIDIDVLKNAPIDMICAGAGDMIGKHTSLLDWKLAHILKGERYESDIVERMKRALYLCIGSAKGLVSRNENAVAALIEGLILSGIEMQNAGNSRPASGCEHHISHYLEMAAKKRSTYFAPHGVQVALGCLAGVIMYRFALEKLPEKSAELKEDILSLPTVNELASLFEDIGLPASFDKIGVDKELLSETILNAYTVRERFTVMTLLCENGLLQEAANEVLFTLQRKEKQ